MPSTAFITLDIGRSALLEKIQPTSATMIVTMKNKTVSNVLRLDKIGLSVQILSTQHDHSPVERIFVIKPHYLIITIIVPDLTGFTDLVEPIIGDMQCFGAERLVLL
jgi:hypothetical protein